MLPTWIITAREEMTSQQQQPDVLFLTASPPHHTAIKSMQNKFLLLYYHFVRPDESSMAFPIGHVRAESFPQQAAQRELSNLPVPL